jgi:hypothetical protein
VLFCLSLLSCNLSITGTALIMRLAAVGGGKVSVAVIILEGLLTKTDCLKYFGRELTVREDDERTRRKVDNGEEAHSHSVPFALLYCIK